MSSVQNVLVSVFNKEGLKELVSKLPSSLNYFSSGGTYQFLKKEFSNLQLTLIEDLTQFPEVFDGRVKTLHPKVFGGILARRDVSSDMATLSDFAIPRFDLVICNLYPFHETRHLAIENQIEKIDVGGPSLLRAAAKNHKFVTVLSDPSDYRAFVDEFDKTAGIISYDFRKKMALRTFQRTSQYDAMIADTWSDSNTFPTNLLLSPQKSLRYGENPHQLGIYAGPQHWKVFQGKELSYNNLLDAEHAYRLVHEFSQSACAIIKHNNPCGVAVETKQQPSNLFSEAFSCDSKSAFGGVVAFNFPVRKEIAEALSPVFLEVVIAPKFLPEAFDELSKKKNLRLVEWQNPHFNPLEIRKALEGYLLQIETNALENWEVVSTSAPQPAFEQDLEFAWKVVKHVRSNAIVIAKNGKTLGIGAGQMSRVDSVQIALEKAKGHSLEGAVLASDAFFPFRDNIDLLKDTGIKVVLQPGGSKQDMEVIAACNEHGIAMIFTGTRHFKH